MFAALATPVIDSDTVSAAPVNVARVRDVLIVLQGNHEFRSSVVGRGQVGSAQLLRSHHSDFKSEGSAPQVTYARIGGVGEIEVVVAHSERVTLRVGDVFLKIDTDQARIDREIEVMAKAPIPTPDVLWHKSPVLALSAIPGTALGVLHEPSTASSTAWMATGAAIRTLHDAPLPPWPSSQNQQQPARSNQGALAFPPLFDSECEWLVDNGVVSADVVRRNREAAEAALRPWTPVFIHGDLQIVHVFIDGDEVSGIVDWSEGGQGDAMYDLATLTLAHEERLDDLVSGYGGDIEFDVIRAYWSLRSLMVIRWLTEHGYGEPSTYPEVAVLNSLSASS